MRILDKYNINYMAFIQLQNECNLNEVCKLRGQMLNKKITTIFLSAGQVLIKSHKKVLGVSDLEITMKVTHLGRMTCLSHKMTRLEKNITVAPFVHESTSVFS